MQWFFLMIGSKQHYKRAIIIGPPAFRWCADDDPALNAGLVALSFLGVPDQYCLETLYFVNIQGWGMGVRPAQISSSVHSS